MNGLTLTIPYALNNKFPVQCWTDHTPLTWIKHTSGKGPVSQFIIDMLSIIDYEMNCIKGEDNKIADGLSRFPMLGPAKLRQRGVKEAVQILLSALTNSNVDPTRLWFNVGKDTQHIISEAYDWRDRITQTQIQPKVRPHCFMDNLSASKIEKIKYSLGIWAPPADKIVRQCRAAFSKGTPFACLIPNDLVHRISIDHNKDFIEPLQRQVDAALKLTLLAPGLTWLIHGIQMRCQIKTVYANSRVTPEFELNELLKILKDSNMTPPLENFRTREEWIEQQSQYPLKDMYSSEGTLCKSTDGLLMITLKEGEPTKTVVPPNLETPLAEWQHKNMCHAGSQKILTQLKKRFHWKHMRRTCRHYVTF